MTTYLIRRFFQSIAFIVVAAFAVFTFLVYIQPGGPYAQFKEQIALDSPINTLPYPAAFKAPWTASELAERYKVDRPWPISFVFWVFDPNDTTQLNGDFTTTSPKGIDIAIGGLHIKGSGAITGDWGVSDSYSRGRPVTELLGTRWGNTFALVGLSLLLSILVSLPIGIIAATRHRSVLDHTITFMSFTGLSIPPFVLGLILIMALSIMPKQIHDALGTSWFPFLPSGGIYNPNNDTLIDRLYHLVLPVITLAIPQIAWLSRYIRFSMLDVLRQDYIRTAWAKGLPMRRVILKHAFRNALIPVITVLGLALPGLASGAIVVESVFGYGGMGQLYYRALGGCLVTQSMLGTDPPPCPALGYAPDYPLALIMTIMLVVIVAFSNMLADILYAVVDPRVNYGAAKAD